MKKLLLLLLPLSNIVGSASGQAPWVIMPGTSTYPSSGYTGFPFGGTEDQNFILSPGTNVLWGITSTGDGYGSPGLRTYEERVFRTADNGQSWQTFATRSTSQTLNSYPTGVETLGLSVVDDQTAWLMQRRYNNAAEVYQLMRTTSGPNGFVVMPGTLPAGTTNWADVHFFSATTGIVIPTRGIGVASYSVYRTTDSGATWTLVASVPDVILTTNTGGFRKTSYGNSLWLNMSSGSVLRTIDGGLTWAVTSDVGKMAFENATTGLAINAQELRETTDGGLTWTLVTYTSQLLPGMLTAVPGRPGTYIGYRNNVYNGPPQSLVVSYDRGRNWQSLPTSNETFRGIVASSPTQLWGLIESYPWYNRAMVLRYVGATLPTTAPQPALSLVVYPNPTTGTVQIAGPLPGAVQARVYDAAGRLCQEGTMLNAQHSLDLSTQAPGLYQLVLTAADGTVRRQRVSKL